MKIFIANRYRAIYTYVLLVGVVCYALCACILCYSEYRIRCHFTRNHQILCDVISLFIRYIVAIEFDNDDDDRNSTGTNMHKTQEAPMESRINEFDDTQYIPIPYTHTHTDRSESNERRANHK